MSLVFPSRWSILLTMLGILLEHWRNGAIIFIRETDRAEAETWSIKMEATADHPAFAPRHRRRGDRDNSITSDPRNSFVSAKLKCQH
jgi:hypothetical protein